MQRRGFALQRTGGALAWTGVALQRTAVALGAVDRTGVALMRTGGARDRAGVALQRTGDPPYRTGGAMERPRHVLPLEHAAAHTAGPLMIYQMIRNYMIYSIQPLMCSKSAPMEHLRPTGMMFVRAYVCHTGKVFTPYLVVVLSSRAEIW